MKTILLIFSVFLLPISLFGQMDVNKSDSNPLLKSTNGVKLRLDSIRPALYDGFGSTFYYDSRGKNIKSDGFSLAYNETGKLVTIKDGDKIRDSITYNPNGQILTWIQYGILNDGPWSPIYKSEYTYDPSQNKKTIYVHSAMTGWLVGPEVWTSFFNDRYIQIMYGAVCETEDCIDTKYVFNYDSNWNMISKIAYFRDEISQSWKEMRRVEYSYDTNDNLISVIYSDGRKLEFKYDNTYSFNDLYLPYKYYGLYDEHLWYWETDFMNHKRTERIDYRYDSNSGQWVKGGTYKYYFSDHIITGIEDIPKEELVVYPNPSNDYIRIETNDNSQPTFIELYDSQGRMVIKEEIPQDKRIQVEHLPRGLYIYKLNYDNTIKTGKIVLQ